MEVYALIGPAGTGKSHRATVVAHDYEIDLIIDDGLLIQGSRILGGRSAKRETTKVAAVRRAIFTDPEQRDEARRVIAQLQPSRILVLGTSTKMVGRILSALDLPSPTRVIPIEEVASPEEILQARRTRRQQGKHVVPAPTFEVKKTFSGYLVDPLRLLYRPKHSRDDLMIEKSVVRPTFSSLGRFFIAESVIATIAERAVVEVDGIEQAGRVIITAERDGVAISMDVTILYGVTIGSVLRAGQARVRQVVEHMTALNVSRVDITARKLVLSRETTGLQPADRETIDQDEPTEFDFARGQDGGI